jgi:hypothetical protein
MKWMQTYRVRGVAGRNSYRIMLDKTARKKKYLQELRLRLNIILKWILKKCNVYEMNLAQNKIQSQKSKLIKCTDLGRKPQLSIINFERVIVHLGHYSGTESNRARSE